MMVVGSATTLVTDGDTIKFICSDNKQRDIYTNANTVQVLVGGVQPTSFVTHKYYSGIKLNNNNLLKIYKWIKK